MSPKNEVIQMMHQNPDASMPLILPVLVIQNTPDEILAEHIKINSAKPLQWLSLKEEHDGSAIFVGGGPSIEDTLDEIKSLKNDGGTVFAMNGASMWLREHGVEVDYQCIVDAKEETAMLVDPDAKAHLFGSQVHPKTMDAIKDPIVWHLEIGEIEQFFPEERKKRGGYVLLGGGAAVGNSSLCAAYAMGFRDLHVFGMDSCHKNGNSHAYPQDINLFIPVVETQWADKKFISSVAMKSQAEKFQITSEELKTMGCQIHVYGEGLLQTMYRTKFEDLSEREKYQMMWNYDAYRAHSPGERIAQFFVNLVHPTSLVIDFGCGTGRGSLAIAKSGVDTLLIDFADNCRDDEAQALPFIQWDLTKPIPASSEFGFCADVMEHIPTDDVPKVISNIMTCSRKVFFQISTVDDDMGEYIGKPLHLTVKPHDWWWRLFEASYDILWESKEPMASLFVVKRRD